MYRFIYSTIDLLPATSSVTQLQRSSTDVCGDYCVALNLTVARWVHMGSFASYWKDKQDRDFVIGSMIQSKLHRHWYVSRQLALFACYLMFIYALYFVTNLHLFICTFQWSWFYRVCVHSCFTSRLFVMFYQNKVFYSFKQSGHIVFCEHLTY